MEEILDVSNTFYPQNQVYIKKQHQVARHVSTIIVSMFELRSCLDKKQSLRLKSSTLPLNNIFFPKKKEKKTNNYIADEDRSLSFTLATSLALSKRHQSY